MDNTNYTTEHRKGQHLLSEERHEIEVRLKDGWSIYRIAKHLGRPLQYDQERDQAWDRVTLQWKAAPLQGRRGQEGVPGKPSELPQAVPLLDFGTVSSIRRRAFQERRQMVSRRQLWQSP